MIGIVDYGMGNIPSLSNALEFIGADHKVIRTPEELATCKAAILPGVGSFKLAMSKLNEQNLVQPLKDFAEAGQPLMGICLGMQLLAEVGMEHADSEDGTPGLGFIEGHVTRLEPGELRVPHVGFNILKFSQDDKIVGGLPDSAHFYFVHSFELRASNDDQILGKTDYGHGIVAAVRNKNVWGFQFHPEKSQSNGLRLLINFKEHVESC